MTSSPESSETSTVAKQNDPEIFLKGTDSSEMYRYVMQQGMVGTAIGLGTMGGLSYLAHRYTRWYRTGTNTSARAFLVVGGAAVGFTIASGFTRQAAEEEQRLVLKRARQNYIEQVKDRAWDNRFRLIAAAWATTLSVSLYRSFNNPYLNSVAKFGHARIAAQFVTLAGVILAFGMDADHGLLTPYIHKRDESKESRN